jgi:hypothetical protein
MSNGEIAALVDGPEVTLTGANDAVKKFLTREYRERRRGGLPALPSSPPPAAAPSSVPRSVADLYRALGSAYLELAER